MEDQGIETQRGFPVTERKHPLRKPRGHKPPVPRWTLRLPEGVTHIYTLYVGVQSHTTANLANQEVEEAVRGILESSDGNKPVIDAFRVTDGFDQKGAKVWVAYWTDESDCQAILNRLNLVQLWKGSGSEKAHVGLWTEKFVTPVERLETNYARLDHKPGVAQIPGCEQPGHELTAYWGSGRDRLPASAQDSFDAPRASETAFPETEPKGIGERIHGSNYENMCHIRSGQWWEKCDVTERTAYEDDLQIKLMEGMQYLWENPQETGTLGLRFLFNIDDQGRMVKESSGAGFFRNWADLERWSSTHPSHLAIFIGAMKHAQKFGAERKFMTWHEVSILKAGEVDVEYVNCAPGTGLLGRVNLAVEAL